MDVEVQQLPVLRRDAFVEGIDEATRTIRFRFSTGARRKTIDWNTWRYVDEELSCDPNHVRMDRLRKGAPFLKDHRASMDCQIGVHKDAWCERGECWGTVKLFEDEDSEKCYQKIRGGAKNISVGYRVHTYEITEREGQRPLYRAIDWEPLENSLVAINADADAQIRSDGTAPEDLVSTRDATNLAPVRLIRSFAMTPEQLALAASQQRFASNVQVMTGTTDLARAEAEVTAAIRIAKAARSATGKDDAAEAEGALQALKAARTRAAELETENAELKAKVLRLESTDTQRELDVMVEGGLRSGKLAEGQEAWARSLVVTVEKLADGTEKRTYHPEGLKQLRAYLEVAIPKGPGVQTRQEATTTSTTEPKNAPVILSDSDREVAKRLGVTEENMKLTKAAERRA